MWTTAAGKNQSVQVKAPLLSATVPALCGTVNFTVSVTTSASAKYPNATSTPAGPVPFVSSATCVGAPNPPGALSVK